MHNNGPLIKIDTEFLRREEPWWALGWSVLFCVIAVIAVTAITTNPGGTPGYDENFCGPGTHWEWIGSGPIPNQQSYHPVTQCLPNGVSLIKPPEPAAPAPAPVLAPAR